MDLPSEILENVMLRSSYEDIISLCKVDTVAASICSDHQFWINKLDNDFTKMIDSQLFVPSEYVALYGVPNENARHIYERWLRMYEIKVNDDYPLLDNRDIVMFMLDTDGYNDPRYTKYSTGYSSRYIFSTLYKLAAQYGDINILDTLYGAVELSRLDKRDLEKSAIKYGQIPVLDWLVSKGVTFTTTHTIAAIYDNNLDILKYLVAHGVPLTQDDANMASKLGKYEILNWLKTQGLVPYTVTGNTNSYRSARLEQRIYPNF